MSINLLQTLQSKFGSQLPEYSANFFDEDQANTEKAINGSFAAVLAGMVQKVSHDKGAKSLHKVLSEEEVRDYDIEQIFTRSPQTVNGLVNRGNHFLPSIYPGRLKEAINSVSADSNVSKLNTSKLMRVSTPFLLNELGRHVQENNLDINGLKTLLNGQKSALTSALPDDFAEKSELSAFGWVKKEKAVKEKPAKTKVDEAEKERRRAEKERKIQEKKALKEQKLAEQKAVAEAKKVEKAVPIESTTTTQTAASSSGSGLGFLKWLLPLLLMCGLAWFLLTRVIGCGGTDNITKTVTSPAKSITNTAKNVTKSATNTVKSAAETTKDAATSITKSATSAVTSTLGKVNDAALNTLNSVKFAAGSAGSQMMNFIKGGATGDGRFKFNNLNFASGSAVIDGASGSEVDNLAAILKAYPDLKVKIEGYTDSQGDADANQLLSQNRANAVKERLQKIGIPANRVTVQGFGAANPVADNGTPEGRAQNRRIEVVIVK